MQSSPQAKRTTETLARIALINERRALAAVTRAQRTLDEQSALRQRLQESQWRDEQSVLNADAPLSAGLLQMLVGARHAHTRRLGELDKAMGDTASDLSQRHNAHAIARHRQRSASKVATRVLSNRRHELQHAQQKVDDDLSSTRFRFRAQLLGNH
jgi:hypothetical protein